jgi:hypothetical protein
VNSLSITPKRRAFVLSILRHHLGEDSNRLISKINVFHPIRSHQKGQIRKVVNLKQLLMQTLIDLLSILWAEVAVGQVWARRSQKFKL